MRKKSGGRVRLTAGRVESFACPAGKSQAFLWDTETPALALRVTPTGRKTYVFESRLNGATIRINIGTAADWGLDAARTRTQGLKMLVDGGTDPREVERQREVSKAAERTAAAAQLEADKVAAVTVGDVWAVYLKARRPHWGELHYKDHIKLARAGGELAKRGTDGRGVTIAMPLHPLMALRLRDLNAPTIEAWAAREAKTRPTSARLAWRLLKVFLNWCAEQPGYAALLPAKNAAATRKAREALGKPQAKTDALMREQLPVWFAAVRNIGNPVIAAALQTMLLTGARPGEVLAMRWADLNLQWRGLTIRDKVEGERAIPLTPYVAQLLAGLPRRNKLVFASASAAGGAVTLPRKHHVRACTMAGIDGLTLHGLRRSFKSLTEWLEIPAGVVAQIMGHKPSATAEKHYTVRPLDLLRVHHERIETWILDQAAVPPAAVVASGKLRVVS
jgi:integrase